MNRYIDADGLVQKINAYVITTQDVEYIKKLINETEPADVAPVIHAHWIINPKYSIVCNCSNCGVAVRGGLGQYYCFNCGAKMDEEVE